MPGSNENKNKFISRNAGSGNGVFNPWASYLVANGGTGAFSDIDAEMRFMASKGYTQPFYSDRLSAYLGGKGFTTGTIVDRYNAFLATGTL